MPKRRARDTNSPFPETTSNSHIDPEVQSLQSHSWLSEDGPLHILCSPARRSNRKGCDRQQEHKYFMYILFL